MSSALVFSQKRCEQKQAIHYAGWADKIQNFAHLLEAHKAELTMATESEVKTNSLADDATCPGQAEGPADASLCGQTLSNEEWTFYTFHRVSTQHPNLRAVVRDTVQASVSGNLVCFSAT